MRAARRNFTLGAEAIGLLMPMHVLIDAKEGAFRRGAHDAQADGGEALSRL